MERKVRKIFQREFHKFVLSYNGFGFRKENENCWCVFNNNPIYSSYVENDEKKILLFCDRFASRFGNAGKKSIHILSFLFDNPTIEEKENSMMHGTGKTEIAENDIVFYKRAMILHNIIYLFPEYAIEANGDKDEFLITTPSHKLVFSNNKKDVMEFCACLCDVPGCKDKSKYTHLMNDLYELNKEEKMEKKPEGTKIAFLIIKQEREELAESIADTSKTLLLMEDKTSWMYKQNEKLLAYFNAMFKVVDEQYNLNK